MTDPKSRRIQTTRGGLRRNGTAYARRGNRGSEIIGQAEMPIGIKSADEIVAEFYRRSGLTEKWLRQRADERTSPPSMARIERARWMARKLTGGSLRTRRAVWAIVRHGSSRSEVDAAFAQGKGMTFDAIEDMLFRSFKPREIPNFLASYYRTWRAIKALEELSDE